MANKSKNDNEYEKLWNLKNYWKKTNLPQAILKEKKVWDIINDLKPKSIKDE